MRGAGRYRRSGPQRSSKRRPRDLKLRAVTIIQAATDGELEADAPPAPKKSGHAAAQGKLGGAKSGPARAEKLTAARRREIAKKAAARWEKRPGS